MDFIITFFRDVLDGPIYIVVSVICGILLCSCIGYLAEVHFNKKKEAVEYQNTHAEVSLNTPSNVGNVAMQQNTVQNTQPINQNYTNTPSVPPNNQGMQNVQGIQNNQVFNNTVSNNVGSVKENQ